MLKEEVTKDGREREEMLRWYEDKMPGDISKATRDVGLLAIRWMVERNIEEHQGMLKEEVTKDGREREEMLRWYEDKMPGDISKATRDVGLLAIRWMVERNIEEHQGMLKEEVTKDGREREEMLRWYEDKMPGDISKATRDVGLLAIRWMVERNIEEHQGMLKEEVTKDGREREEMLRWYEDKMPGDISKATRDVGLLAIRWMVERNIEEHQGMLKEEVTKDGREREEMLRWYEDKMPGDISKATRDVGLLAIRWMVERNIEEHQGMLKEEVTKDGREREEMLRWYEDKMPGDISKATRDVGLLAIRWMVERNIEEHQGMLKEEVTKDGREREEMLRWYEDKMPGDISKATRDVGLLAIRWMVERNIEEHQGMLKEEVTKDGREREEMLRWYEDKMPGDISKATRDVGLLAIRWMVERNIEEHQGMLKEEVTKDGREREEMLRWYEDKMPGDISKATRDVGLLAIRWMVERNIEEHQGMLKEEVTKDGREREEMLRWYEDKMPGDISKATRDVGLLAIRWMVERNIEEHQGMLKEEVTKDGREREEMLRWYEDKMPGDISKATRDVGLLAIRWMVERNIEEHQGMLKEEVTKDGREREEMLRWYEDKMPGDISKATRDVGLLAIRWMVERNIEEHQGMLKEEVTKDGREREEMLRWYEDKMPGDISKATRDVGLLAIRWMVERNIEEHQGMLKEEVTKDGREREEMLRWYEDKMPGDISKATRDVGLLAIRWMVERNIEEHQGMLKEEVTKDGREREEMLRWYEDKMPGDISKATRDVGLLAIRWMVERNIEEHQGMLKEEVTKDGREREEFSGKATARMSFQERHSGRSIWKTRGTVVGL